MSSRLFAGQRPRETNKPCICESTKGDMVKELFCLSVYRDDSSIWMRTCQNQERSRSCCKRILLTLLSALRHSCSGR